MKLQKPEKILIISRVPELYSNQRLVQELKHKNLLSQIIPPESEMLKEATKESQKTPIAALIRLASWRFQEALETLKIWRDKVPKIKLMNSVEAVEFSRNKWHSLQALEKNLISTPLTQLISRQELSLIDLPFPFVLKELFSSQGLGVHLIQNLKDLQSALEIWQGSDLFIAHSYIKECHGEDLRIFVTTKGDHWSMIRKNSSGDFRSNIRQGGKGFKDTPSREELEMAFRTLKLFDLDYAGVDILRSVKGPLMMDVNPSPGFESLEGLYGPQVAGPLIDLLLRARGPHRAGSR